MVKNYKIEYDDGRVVEKSSIGWEDEPGFISGISRVTETDHRGNERITTKGVAIPGKSVETTGLTSFQGTSEGLEATAFVAGGVLGAIIVPVAIVYGAGKLVYRIATIGKENEKEKNV